MANAKYFIIETKKALNPPDPEINDQLAFSKDFTIDNRYFIALEFKQPKANQEVKNLIFGQNSKDVPNERIIPIIKEIKKYSRCDTLYVTNIPKTLNDPKQLIEKFCIGVGNVQKKLCYYTVISGRENLDRLIHFLPAIPIDRKIMASYSCVDFPILRFSNLSSQITEQILESFILQNAQCQVVDIKMSKMHQNKNDRYANVLFQSVEEIEKVTKLFNFFNLCGNEIYVKQFLEPELGNEIKKYEIAVVDLPEDTNRINFFKEMSNFGRIFEFSFDEESLIGYVVFVTSDARKNLLKSEKFHSFYSLVNILVGNFPPGTTCDDAKNYVIETIKKNSNPKKGGKKSLRITKNNNDITLEIQKKENDDFDKKLTDENYEFDPNSIKEVKIYQEEDQLSPDSTDGKLYFTLPTFSIKFNHPSEIDFVLDKLKSGIYKDKTAPFAIRYYTQSKYNDNERSGIFKNLGYDNAIVISPIDQKVTLTNLFDICSNFGIILYFQVNLKKKPNYCIVKYQTSEIANEALNFLDGSVLNKQKISAMEFQQEKKRNLDQSDNSESQEKVDDFTKENKSKCKCKKKCQCNYQDYDNQHHQYPYPYFQGQGPPHGPPPFPPFMRWCPPFGRPPFGGPPMFPPPFQHPFFQGQRPPPGPPPEWMNFYYGRGGGPCKHHKQNHGKKEESFIEDGNDDNKNREKMNEQTENRGRRRRDHKRCERRNYFCQNNEPGNDNQTDESEENQERRRCHHYWKNYRCRQNGEKQNETINNEEKSNNNNDDNQTDELEENQERRRCHHYWKNYRCRQNGEKQNEAFNNEEKSNNNDDNNQTDESAEMPKRRCYYRNYWDGNDETEYSGQNQMNQNFFRGHGHHRNHWHYGRGMWRMPNPDEFDGCQNYNQPGEENVNQFCGRGRRFRREGRGGRCGRGKRWYQNVDQQKGGFPKVSDDEDENINNNEDEQIDETEIKIEDNKDKNIDNKDKNIDNKNKKLSKNEELEEEEANIDDANIDDANIDDDTNIDDDANIDDDDIDDDDDDDYDENNNDDDED